MGIMLIDKFFLDCFSEKRFFLLHTYFEAENIFYQITVYS
jgi:hypothetical protein